MRSTLLATAAIAALLAGSPFPVLAQGAAPAPAPAVGPVQQPSAPNPTPNPNTATAPAQQFPLRDAPTSFAPLARQLLPAVVNVQTTTTIQARGNRPDAPEVPQAPPGSPFEDFFRDFLNRNRPGGRPDQPQTPRRAQSLGSGFIIDAKEGIVVTNNHVIDGADEINVVLQDNTTIKATLLGTDTRTDIAVLQIKTDHPLSQVNFGNSDDANVGDWVLAIGNPFGLGGSVTAGIVSARGRDIRQGMYDDFIQTDAAINRGNSGGPLFNLQGQVIGINTAIYSPSGGSIGIGFSIPSNLAKNIAAQLRNGGSVKRGWLGVNIQQVTDDIADSLGLKGGARGALVARAQEDGPAAKGGIRNGDIILRFNNQDVHEMRNLPRIVADTAVGTDAPVVVWRDGKEETVTVKVAELPADQANADNNNAPSRGPAVVELAGTGLKVTAVTPETRDRFSLKPDAKGVVVTDVAGNSSAAERGIAPGDLIVEAQQTRVNTPQELQKRLDDLRKANRNTVLLLVENAQGQRFVPLTLRSN
ncbi:DegQ family serine endoprotease [Roseomonas elaeocarpi]|uniref:Probable periplasmic serine endoprotease DegP-like n=1 Tax=Roseomonas elaeocarpi TaxID=907779 RepID=A0ABV6JT43_9PROT